MVKEPFLDTGLADLFKNRVPDQTACLLAMSPHNLNVINKNDVMVITQNGNEYWDYRVKDLGDTLHQQVSEIKKASNQGQTFKVDNIDTMCDVLAALKVALGAVDACVFISKKGGPSFPMHHDDVDVYLYPLVGSKTFNFETHASVSLQQGQCLVIPAGVKHQAVNTSDCILLSYGVVTNA